MSEQTKVCSKCGIAKCLIEFSKASGYRAGVRAQCKLCRANLEAMRRELFPEKSREISSAWKMANKEKAKNCFSDWYLKNKIRARQEARIRSAEWKKSNPEKAKAKKHLDVKDMSRNYVSSLMGFRVSEITEELLQLKREQLRIHRITKQLKKEIENV